MGTITTENEEKARQFLEDKYKISTDVADVKFGWYEVISLLAEFKND